MKKVLLLLGVFFAVVAMAQDKIYVYFSDGSIESYDVNKMDSICFGATLWKDGILPGKFSVSATKQVQFAQGNLQYQASTDTWRFAENQYEALGKEANEKISSTNTGWRDLFDWGTSGNNKISNGGNMVGKWRTLTQEEWEYIFNGRANAANLRSQAWVCGVNGYLLLPDGFKCPDGITFTPRGSFSDNYYGKSQWQSLEAGGAVFLPCAGYGYRNGDYIIENNTNRILYKVAVYDVGSHGYYWSSSAFDVSGAYIVDFDSGHARVIGSYARVNSYRCNGYSVRLATE